MKTTVTPTHDPDLLAGWIDRKHRRATATRPGAATDRGGLRFAFYGRVSTEDFQDRASSARWQRNFAEDLIAGHGTIVVEFFDVGYSRRVAWADRPQAAQLLAALADPDRGFDAIVVGEFERAFYGDQFVSLAALLDRHGVPLWLPEVDGPVDVHSHTHQALMMLLGVHSKREVLRSRYRVTAAMRAQASEQGRHLGGRPPYGYRLVDAGPHPNRAHARWGRRLHRLDPDPTTAAVTATPAPSNATTNGQRTCTYARTRSWHSSPPTSIRSAPGQDVRQSIMIKLRWLRCCTQTTSSSLAVGPPGRWKPKRRQSDRHRRPRQNGPSHRAFPDPALRCPPRIRRHECIPWGNNVSEPDTDPTYTINFSAVVRIE
jgi:DNA invertase Pin-like site-specific DNA recombinase